MATIKAYTDISQSKTLSKILPLESADMYYPWYIEEDGDTIESGHRITTPNVGNFTTHKINKMILPCWSLAGLLDVLPRIDIEKEICSDDIYDYRVKAYIGYGYIGDWHDNPVDACVAMIEKLNEFKML